MSSLFRKRFKIGRNPDRLASAIQSVTASGNIQVTDGNLKYVGEQGGNSAPIAYQEASGAPIETHSPLGYNVGPITIVFLNLSKMIGTGIWFLNLKILICINQLQEYSRHVCGKCFDQN